MIIEIDQFDEWIKDNYQFDLIVDLGILRKTERTTFDTSVLDDVSAIRERMMNRRRPLADKLTVKKYCYIHYYLINFLKYRPDNFDKLLTLVNLGKPIFVQDLQKMNK